VCGDVAGLIAGEDRSSRGGESGPCRLQSQIVTACGLELGEARLRQELVYRGERP
jgi:hypothetical protein